MESKGSRFALNETVWAWLAAQQTFERATIERHESHKGVMTVKLKSGSVVDLKDDLVHKTNLAAQDAVPDNTIMRELNEATLLHNVRSRYELRDDDGGVYSFTGHILIAVNPFRELNIYTEAHVRASQYQPFIPEPEAFPTFPSRAHPLPAMPPPFHCPPPAPFLRLSLCNPPFRRLSQMKKYLGRAIGSQPPHIFAIADRMYRILVSQGESQASLPLHPRVCACPPEEWLMWGAACCQVFPSLDAPFGSRLRPLHPRGVRALLF